MIMAIPVEGNDRKGADKKNGEEEEAEEDEEQQEQKDEQERVELFFQRSYTSQIKRIFPKFWTVR